MLWIDFVIFIYLRKTAVIKQWIVILEVLYLSNSLFSGYKLWFSYSHISHNSHFWYSNLSRTNPLKLISEIQYSAIWNKQNRPFISIFDHFQQNLQIIATHPFNISVHPLRTFHNNLLTCSGQSYHGWQVLWLQENRSSHKILADCASAWQCLECIWICCVTAFSHILSSGNTHGTSSSSHHSSGIKRN